MWQNWVVQTVHLDFCFVPPVVGSWRQLKVWLFQQTLTQWRPFSLTGPLTQRSRKKVKGDQSCKEIIHCGLPDCNRLQECRGRDIVITLKLICICMQHLSEAQHHLCHLRPARASMSAAGAAASHHLCARNKAKQCTTEMGCVWIRMSKRGRWSADNLSTVINSNPLIIHLNPRFISLILLIHLPAYWKNARGWCVCVPICAWACVHVC